MRYTNIGFVSFSNEPLRHNYSVIPIMCRSCKTMTMDTDWAGTNEARAFVNIHIEGVYYLHYSQNAMLLLCIHHHHIGIIYIINYCSILCFPSSIIYLLMGFPWQCIVVKNRYYFSEISRYRPLTKILKLHDISWQ